MVVFVVTVDDEVFFIWVLSREVVLVISKTLLGARSRGLMTVLVPASLSNSMITPCSAFSPSSLVLVEVMLETDEVLVGWVEFDDISEAINAAFTSGAREFQASKTFAGSEGDDNAFDSSLSTWKKAFEWERRRKIQWWEHSWVSSKHTESKQGRPPRIVSSMYWLSSLKKQLGDNEENKKLGFPSVLSLQEEVENEWNMCQKMDR